MRLHHQAVPPGIGGLARDWLFAVNEAEISDDVGPRGVGGANFAASVQSAVGLVVIRGLRNVWRNKGVVLATLHDAVNLDCQQDGNPVAIQRVGKCDGFRSSPAVSIDNDPRASFFVGGKLAIMIGIERVQNGLVRFLAAVVFKRVDVRTGRVIPANARGKLHAAVHGIVVAHVSADKTDHNDFGRTRLCRCGFVGASKRTVASRNPCMLCGYDLASSKNGREENRESKNRSSHAPDRKSTRLNSSHPSISYAVFCLKKKKKNTNKKLIKKKKKRKKNNK